MEYLTIFPRLKFPEGLRHASLSFTDYPLHGKRLVYLHVAEGLTGSLYLRSFSGGFAGVLEDRESLKAGLLVLYGVLYGLEGGRCSC